MRKYFLIDTCETTRREFFERFVKDSIYNHNAESVTIKGIDYYIDRIVLEHSRGSEFLELIACIPADEVN